MTSESPAPHHRRIFDRANLIAILILFALILVCVALSWTTRDAMSRLSFLKRKNSNFTQKTLVDLRPWQTAQELTSLAVTQEEIEYAHEAERLADHEVDQAFATALRQAQAIAQHRALKGAALALSQKANQFQKLVHDDQLRVQSLTANSMPDSETDSLDLARAQLGLDTDQLNDAQDDLARALGDDRTRIQQELTAHESAMKKYDSEVAAHSQTAIATSEHYGTLARRLFAWLDQRTRYQLIEQAASQADADALALSDSHKQAESQGGPAAADTTDIATRLDMMKGQSIHSQMLSLFDERIETHQQLAALYRKWAAQVLLQHRIVFHLLMQSCALLLAPLLVGLLLHGLLSHFLQRRILDRRRLNTLRIVSKLIIQIITAVLILLVVFGAPSQMPTIVGFTTAGLTVVLQDFIISFCGWFVLMGKNGIRAGDWVEINGVGGEVVEVGLFRTALLETGNWTDHGHPTGRRVTFINSFAIKGQYFNFSTTGQWLWDELTLSIPASQNPYATVELVHKAILAETESESHLAETEWARLAHNNTMSRFSASPAVNLRPGVMGIDLLVRYVTRASNRYEMRNRLYTRVIELLHTPQQVG